MDIKAYPFAILFPNAIYPVCGNHSWTGSKDFSVMGYAIDVSNKLHVKGHYDKKKYDCPLSHWPSECHDLLEDLLRSGKWTRLVRFIDLKAFSKNETFVELAEKNGIDVKKALQLVDNGIDWESMKRYITDTDVLLLVFEYIHRKKLEEKQLRKLAKAKAKEEKKAREKKRRESILESCKAKENAIIENGDIFLVKYIQDARVFLAAHPEKEKALADHFHTIKSFLKTVCENSSPWKLVEEMVEGDELDFDDEYFDYDEDLYFNIPRVKNRSNDSYQAIIDSAWPGNVKTVSMLRHWNNVWCELEDFAEWHKVPLDTIERIIEFAPGHLTLNDAIKNIDRIQQEEEERRKRIENAKISAEIDIRQLEWARKNFCRKGTRQIKLDLNKLVKKGDPEAKALRLALEAQDKSIAAKMSVPFYREKVYRVKQRLVSELFETCIANGYTCGLQPSNVPSTTHVAYFELPGCEQISFHFSPEGKEYPEYNKKWDGKENSTLDKLEEAIMKKLKISWED